MTAGATSTKKANPFPISVREGDVEARINRTPTTIRGVKYDSFSVCWYLNGSRKRRRFSDLNAARSEAERIVREKSHSALGIAAFSASDPIALESALPLLAKAKGTGCATPSRLAQVVQDYTAAAAELAFGIADIPAPKTGHTEVRGVPAKPTRQRGSAPRRGCRVKDSGS